MKEPYLNWVLNEHWVWINFIGFAGSILGLFALLAIFSHLQVRRTFEYVGVGLGIIGIVILTCILFFEAFVLKGIALIQPDLVVLNSGFYLFSPFKAINLVGGILFSIGIFLLGLKLIKESTFKKWKTIMLMVGMSFIWHCSCSR
jgi:hypothetical protein